MYYTTTHIAPTVSFLKVLSLPWADPPPHIHHFAKLPSWPEWRWSLELGRPTRALSPYWACPCDAMHHHREWDKLLGGHPRMAWLWATEGLAPHREWDKLLGGHPRMAWLWTMEELAPHRVWDKLLGGHPRMAWLWTMEELAPHRVNSDWREKVDPSKPRRGTSVQEVFVVRATYHIPWGQNHMPRWHAC